MGVDVPDDFAGKMKGDDEKGPQQSANDDDRFPPFCYIFLSRVFSSYFNGRPGKKKKKRTSDQISRIHPNRLIWEDRRRLSPGLPGGYYSTPTLFFFRSFVRSTPFSVSWEWIWWFLHHTQTHTNVQYKRHTRMVATIWDLIGRNAFTPAFPPQNIFKRGGGGDRFLLTAFPSFRLPPPSSIIKEQPG